MTAPNGLVVQGAGREVQVSDEMPWTHQQVEVIKRTIISYGSEPATDDELWLFGQVCKRTGLDPFTKKIYAIKRFSKKLKEATGGAKSEAMTIQVGIDGLRLQTKRTGKYGGQIGPFWTDGSKDANGQVKWTDLWTERNSEGGIVPPFASKVGIVMVGSPEPYWGVATWAAFAPYDLKDEWVNNKKTGKKIRVLSPMWKKMGDNQLAKCAEAQGHRKAAPGEAGDLYIAEEMQQADDAKARGEGIPLITALRHERDLIGWETWKVLKAKILGPARADQVGRFQDLDEREQELMLEGIEKWKSGPDSQKETVAMVAPVVVGQMPSVGKPGEKVSLAEAMKMQLEMQAPNKTALTWLWCPDACGTPIFYDEVVEEGVVTSRVPIGDGGQIHDCKQGTLAS